MSDVRISDDYYHLVYDPLLHGYTDGYFKTSAGTPAISTNVLRFNAAAAYTNGQYMFGEYEFKIKVPTTPTGASLIAGAAGTTAITTWDQITDGEFAVTIDGNDYDVLGINFSGGVYTPAYLTGGNAATSAIDTWAAVTAGGFQITIDGTLRSIASINFKTAFPYTSAFLTGGVAATSAIDTWAAVTDGSFAMTIDGTLRSVSGINFKTSFPYVSAFLTGGVAATSNVDTWAAVTDGSFTLTVDGTPRDVTAIDFSAVAAYTPAFLTGGVAATSNPLTWEAVTDGEFRITINGTERTITAIDFSNVVAYTPALLTGGGAATTNPAIWAAIADGEFKITINGVVRTVTAINFAGVVTMADVASKIQIALRAVTTLTETVIWSTDHFVVTSSVTTSSSAITEISTVAAPAGTDISGAGGTDFMDSDVGHGVVTNKVSNLTMANVATKLQSVIQTATGSTETVVWSTNHFVVSSVLTTSASAITVTSAVAIPAGTDISGAGATTFMDAEVGNGTVTNKASLMTMTQVATKIQTALRAVTLSTETVVWSTNHFIISSVNTTVDSAITVLSAQGGGTDISGAGATTFMDGDVGNGTVTNHVTTKTLTDVAAKIQVAIRALTSSTETVVWSTNHFVISSVNSTVDSAITVTSATGGGTDISGAGGTTFMDSETLVGIVTNHTTTKTLTDVAALIQTALRAVTLSTETVIWSTNHFKISSVNTTSISAVSVTTASLAGTDISGAGVTTFMDAEVGNGTVTKRAMASQMDYIALKIQEVLQLLTGGTDTVVWSTDHFIIATDTSSGVSSISVLSAVAGGTGTDISGAGYINGLVGTGTLTTGTVKAFGLKIPAMGTTNYILFQIVGDKLLCKVCDSAGSVESATVLWLAAWTNTDTTFGIQWYADNVRFLVNGKEVAKLTESVTRDVSLPVYVNNENTDNMDLSYIFLKAVRKTNDDFSLLNVNIDASDIEIGAVELKDSSTDVRADIKAANTARTTGTIVIATQPIDAAGNVLGRTAANTARTTGTLVDPVQLVDAAGDVIGIDAANTARTTGTKVLPVQPIDAAGNVLGRTAANTARTTGTLVDPVQIIDAAGDVIGVDAANTARTVATKVLPVQTVDEAGNVLGRTAANTARTTATLVNPVQIIDAAGDVIGVDAANTARTVATKVLSVQNVAANGSPTPSGIITDPIFVKDSSSGTDVVVLNATGGVALNTTTAVAAEFKLLQVTIHFSAAPTTSEEFLLKLDAVAGAAYDTVLWRINPSLSAATDIVFTPYGEMKFKTGDELVAMFLNTDTVTYGLSIYYQLI